MIPNLHFLQQMKVYHKMKYSSWAADLICLMNLFTSCMHPSNSGEGRYMEWELNGLRSIHSSLS